MSAARVVAIPDLRQRRRAQTARELHTVAVQLARELGFDVVTVDAIAEAAGVSPRTFFNYFPTKEAAIVHIVYIVYRPPLRTSTGRAPTEVRRGLHEVFNEILDLLVTGLDEQPLEREIMRDVWAIAAQHSAVLAAMLAELDTLAQQLIATAAQRLEVRNDAAEPELIAALAMTAVRIGIERWTKQPDDGSLPTAEIRLVATQMCGIFS
jgi:AcrR family transcriptional regulator